MSATAFQRMRREQAKKKLEEQKSDPNGYSDYSKSELKELAGDLEGFKASLNKTQLIELLIENDKES